MTWEVGVGRRVDSVVALYVSDQAYLVLGGWDAGHAWEDGQCTPGTDRPSARVVRSVCGSQDMNG